MIELLVVLVVLGSATVVFYPVLAGTTPHRPVAAQGRPRPTASGQLDPEEEAERAALLERKDRLLRNLRELEAERAAGRMREADYVELKRRDEIAAAQVLHHLEQLTAETQAARRARKATRAASTHQGPGSNRRRLGTALAWVGGTTAFAVVLGVTMFRAVAPRSPGGTITGSMPGGIAGDTPPGAEAGAGTAAIMPKANAARLAELAAQIRRDSTNLKALLEAGHLYLAEQRLDEAAQATMRALRIDPEAPEAYAHIGVLLMAEGMSQQDPDSAKRAIDGALDALNHAIQLKPDLAEAWLFKGMVLMAGRRDRTGAAQAWEQYLKVAPKDADTTRIHAMVEAVKRAGNR